MRLISRPSTRAHSQARRVALTLLVYLTAGLAINVGAAWFACIRPSGPSKGPLPSSRDPTWPFEGTSHWPRPDVRFDFSKWGCVQSIAESADPDGDNHRLMSGYHAGWPLTSVVGWSTYDREGTYSTHGLVTIGTYPSRRIWLPMLPVWPGIVANTALFGGLVFAAVRLTTAFRRHLHRRSGDYCPICGYDLCGLADGSRCPECGEDANQAAQ